MEKVELHSSVHLLEVKSGFDMISRSSSDSEISDDSLFACGCKDWALFLDNASAKMLRDPFTCHMELKLSR